MTGWAGRSGAGPVGLGRRQRKKKGGRGEGSWPKGERERVWP